MLIFILVGKEVLLVWTKSALIMSFPARTINKTPHVYPVGVLRHYIFIISQLWLTSYPRKYSGSSGDRNSWYQQRNL